MQRISMQCRHAGWLRTAWHSAQRHQGGARRAGDSRGAECRVVL